MKQINPSIIKPLKETLSTIYWTKSDLKSFLYSCFRPETISIIDTLDFTKYKYNIVEELVNRMVKREDIYQLDMIKLIQNLVQFNDFSHFLRCDNKDKLIKTAKENLTHFRIIARPLLESYMPNIDTREIKIDNQKKSQLSMNKLEEFKSQYYELTKMSDSKKKGFAFEIFLNNLFLAFDISSKGSFRNAGEQIDGDFTLDGNEFILEAKWQKDPVSKSEINAFAGKIEDKLKNTLGLFVSINGFSVLNTSASVFRAVILCDSIDIINVLDGRIALDELIKRKKQEASRTGNVYCHVI